MDWALAVHRGLHLSAQKQEATCLPLTIQIIAERTLRVKRYSMKHSNVQIFSNKHS